MLRAALERLFPKSPAIKFSTLSEWPDAALLPPLDRQSVDESQLTPNQKAWRRDGVVVLPNFLPHDLIDAYVEVRKGEPPWGWSSTHPYVWVPEMKALALHRPLMDVMRELISEEMLLHLCLTGWVSTERTWHQDDYLNPPDVNCWYAAVWMALDDIHPDCGPFQYVAGSHRWPLLRREKVLAQLNEEERAREDVDRKWPTYAERFVTPAVEAEMRSRRARVGTFLARKGDVLIWHGRLMHRGSPPNQPGMERRSLIAHYSGVNHREDLPNRMTTPEGSAYAVP